jgi:hypothetical protein
MLSSRGTQGISRGVSGLALLGCGLSALVSCDIPEAPEWEIAATIPVATDTFTWTDFLPPFIVIDTVDGREVFVISLPQQSAEYRLSQLCSLCGELNGQTVTVPPFDFADSLDIPFPDRLYSIEVTETGFDAEIENQLGFDLLAEREPAADPPSLLLVLRDLESLTTLDSVFLGPSAGPVPSGSTLTRRLDIVDNVVTRGVRLVVLFHYPGSEFEVQIDTTRFARLIGRLDGARIPALTLVVDNVSWDDDDKVSLDQNTRDEIVNRFRGGDVEMVVFHDVEANSTLEVSFAATRGELFSQDPQKAVIWGGFELTSGLIQDLEVTLGQLETIATFPEPFYFGYRGVANGTRAGAGGALKLSRITADQRAHVSLKLHSRLLVGK